MLSEATSHQADSARLLGGAAHQADNCLLLGEASLQADSSMLLGGAILRLPVIAPAPEESRHQGCGPKSTSSLARARASAYPRCASSTTVPGLPVFRAAPEEPGTQACDKLRPSLAGEWWLKARSLGPTMKLAQGCWVGAAHQADNCLLLGEASLQAVRSMLLGGAFPRLPVIPPAPEESRHRGCGQKHHVPGPRSSFSKPSVCKLYCPRAASLCTCPRGTWHSGVRPASPEPGRRVVA